MYHPNIKYENTTTMDNEHPLQRLLSILFTDTFRPHSELSSSSRFNGGEADNEEPRHRPDDISVVLLELLKFPVSNNK